MTTLTLHDIEWTTDHLKALRECDPQTFWKLDEQWERDEMEDAWGKLDAAYDRGALSTVSLDLVKSRRRWTLDAWVRLLLDGKLNEDRYRSMLE